MFTSLLFDIKLNNNIQKNKFVNNNVNNNQL